MWPSSATYLKGLGFTAAVFWRTPRRAEAAARTRHWVEVRLYVRSGGEINRKPSLQRAVTGSRPHRFMGRLGRGVWRMGLGRLCETSGVLWVAPPPWCFRPTWSRPARCGWPRGRFGCGWPRRPRGGTGAGPNRADARRSPEATCIAEGGPACMKAVGLTPGTTAPYDDQNNRRQKINPFLHSPIGGPPVYLRREVFSSCRGMGSGVGLPGKP
jgi:hypothetical protein